MKLKHKTLFLFLALKLVVAQEFNCQISVLPEAGQLTSQMNFPQHSLICQIF